MAITGTRFIKLFDGLIESIGRDRFLPIAMIFEDSFRPEESEPQTLDRLVRRVEQQAARMSYSKPIIRFPQQRLFKIDGGNCVRWESPIIWGNSDLIAGKRKINLMFTLLNHWFYILYDLAEEESVYRKYLELAWHQDTSGSRSLFAPGLIQSVFRTIAEDLPLDKVETVLWDAARQRFPEDYVGRVSELSLEDVRTRWWWFRQEFFTMAKERIGEQRAALAWRAIDDTFAASFSEHKPRPDRDQDASPYTLPFNRSVASLNGRLRARITEATEARRAGGGQPASVGGRRLERDIRLQEEGVGT